jgi:hypothetical protein
MRRSRNKNSLVLVDMIRFLFASIAGLSLVGVTACRQNQNATPNVVPETYVANSCCVGFDIVPIQGGNGSTQWLATYTSPGKVAKFRIEIDAAVLKQMTGPEKLQFKFGEGRIRPEPGSDASVLLIDPKRVLEAKKLPTRVIRSNVLPFEYVILGENQSRTADGSFNEKPAGNWTCVKIFLPPGGDDGELYLNFNPAIQKAEFSEKDSDYGNYLLAKFATVL